MSIISNAYCHSNVPTHRPRSKQALYNSYSQWRRLLLQCLLLLLLCVRRLFQKQTHFHLYLYIIS